MNKDLESIGAGKVIWEKGKGFTVRSGLNRSRRRRRFCLIHLSFDSITVKEKDKGVQVQ